MGQGPRYLKAAGHSGEHAADVEDELGQDEAHVPAASSASGPVPAGDLKLVCLVCVYVLCGLLYVLCLYCCVRCGTIAHSTGGVAGVVARGVTLCLQARGSAISAVRQGNKD